MSTARWRRARVNGVLDRIIEGTGRGEGDGAEGGYKVAPWRGPVSSIKSYGASKSCGAAAPSERPRERDEEEKKEKIKSRRRRSRG